MDKYEFNIKVEQIKKLVNKGDFETAMKIADTIDWRRVRSTSLLTMISQIYEKNAEYQDAKDILLLAYERAPLGKGLLYKLTDLALRENNIQEAAPGREGLKFLLLRSLFPRYTPGMPGIKPAYPEASGAAAGFSSPRSASPAFPP